MRQRNKSGCILGKGELRHSGSPGHLWELRRVPGASPRPGTTCPSPFLPPYSFPGEESPGPGDLGVFSASPELCFPSVWLRMPYSRLHLPVTPNTILPKRSVGRTMTCPLFPLAPTHSHRRRQTPAAQGPGARRRGPERRGAGVPGRSPCRLPRTPDRPPPTVAGPGWGPGNAAGQRNGVPSCGSWSLETSAVRPEVPA